MNIETKLFCPHKFCPYYQRTDNIIIKNGTYTTEADKIPRQLFRCTGGEHNFSETAFSELFGKHGSFKEYIQTAKLLKYGNSAEAIADVLERDVRTILVWQRAIGKKSKAFHLFICSFIGLIINFLQMDEIWSYCKNKSHQLWVFIAFESKTKFWIGFELGKRTTSTAKNLVKQVASFISIKFKGIIHVTTDKLSAYVVALAIGLRNLEYVYLQIVKKRVGRKLKSVKKCFVKGTDSDFPPGTQNTSYIERFNLTLRQRVSYLVRKTLGYTKNKIRCAEVLWINLFDYNYLEYHKSLRICINSQKEKFVKRYLPQTPAMAMGLLNERLNWRFLFTVPILQS
jgi:IS1 family transposase